MTQGRGDKIFAVVIIAQSTEEGDKFRIVLIAAHQHFAFLLSP